MAVIYDDCQIGKRTFSMEFIPSVDRARRQPFLRYASFTLLFFSWLFVFFYLSFCYTRLGLSATLTIHDVSALGTAKGGTVCDNTHSPKRQLSSCTACDEDRSPYSNTCTPTTSQMPSMRSRERQALNTLPTRRGSMLGCWRRSGRA